MLEQDVALLSERRVQALLDDVHVVRDHVLRAAVRRCVQPFSVALQEVDVQLLPQILRAVAAPVAVKDSSPRSEATSSGFGSLTRSS